MKEKIINMLFGTKEVCFPEHISIKVLLTIAFDVTQTAIYKTFARTNKLPSQELILISSVNTCRPKLPIIYNQKCFLRLIISCKTDIKYSVAVSATCFRLRSDESGFKMATKILFI